LHWHSNSNKKMSGEADAAGASAASGSLNLGQSVVPDLMKVYESLTQSSTPHAAAAATAAATFAATTDDGNASSSTSPSAAAIATASALASSASGAVGEAGHSLTRSADDGPPPPPPATPSPGRGRGARSSTRKRGRGAAASSGRGRKKTTKADGRWSKRFQWPDELHREFVSAVFDVGLKHASPSALMEFMDLSSGNNSTNTAAVTSERVKSHLQKYRLHRARSKKEFVASYDAALAKMRTSNHLKPRGYLVDADEIAALASGEVAAHLTCAASATDDEAALALQSPASSTPHPAPGKVAAASASATAKNVLHLPQLTEEEKRSPIGASMGYLMGLFFALQQQLSHQRETKQARQQQQQQQQQQETASPLAAPPTNPAGPGYGSYVAPPAVSHAPQPQHQHHNNHHQERHHHQQQQYDQPFGYPGQQAIETSTSAILEENDMMKRDMRAQMRFQNQMRAFKDKEVAKIQQQPPTTMYQQQYHHHEGSQAQRDAFADAVKEQDSAFAAAAIAGEASIGEAGQEDPAAAAGAVPLPGSRARVSSFGLSDAEFWDASVDDNELFDFLTDM